MDKVLKLNIKGYNAELDMIRGDMNSGTDFLAQIEAREKERTGIKNLKIKYCPKKLWIKIGHDKLGLSQKCFD